MLVDQFANREVVLRMLDLGSDKLAIFQHANREENPCMGFRSMRMLLKEPQIFRSQLRAMLRAASPKTTILFPMISGWNELLKINQFVTRICDEMDTEDVAYQQDVKYGLMVEVPGLVERFADFVDDYDVFNIGSNDLTQYTLAADRNNEAVSDYFTFHHPAMISMIYRVCSIAREHGKVVRICGEMGSDIELLPLLVGLGVDHFSVPYRHVPNLKMNLQRLDLELCKQLAAQCLACRTSEQVHKLVRQFKTHSAASVRTTTLSRTARPEA
jgi:phosphotransferase system enzyme I (PtsI)